MADVVMIYPALQVEKHMGRMLPLSCLYPATPLVRKGYTVKIIDQRVDRRWHETLRDTLLAGDVLCVGISSMTGAQIEGGLSAAGIVREAAPGTPVAWGGVHPSILPEQTLAHRAVDAVIVGEGEETLAEAVDRLAEGKRLAGLLGLWCSREGQVVAGGSRPHVDLNALPSLAYDLVDVRDYTRAVFEEEPADWLALLTSRGCPHGCTYCYSETFNKRQWRALTPGRTVEEIERIEKDFSIHHIYLVDDNFFVDAGRVRNICRLLSERKLPVKVHNANWRIDSILACDRELMRLIRDAGFEKVFVGVESGSDGVLKEIGKGFTRAQVLEADRRLREAGIKPVYAFMTGFPFESRRDVKTTLRLTDRLLSNNPDARLPGLSFYTPFPGTRLYDECLRRGMKPPERLQDWSDMSYSSLNFKGFAPGEKRFFRKAAMLSGFLDDKNLRGTGRWKNFIFFLLARFSRLKVRLGLNCAIPEAMLIRRRERKNRD